MAKVTVYDHHGKMTEVELDPQGFVPSSVCGKHAPAKPGLCVNHACELHELHDKEITDTFGVEAIFYCPEFGCDDLAWDVRTSHLIAMGSGCLHRTLDPYSNMRIVVFELFRNAALLKVLFLKQRQLVEKLERSGFFQGGKKI